MLYQTYIVKEDILDKTESILINHFSKKFIKERGREWFKGDINEMISEIEIIIESNNICNFCSKEFSCKMSLTHHQQTVKSCLQIQGKQDINIECTNCNKLLSIKYYKQHKIKCDLKSNKEKDNLEKTNLYNELSYKYKILEEENKTFKISLFESIKIIDKLNKDLYDSKDINDKLKIELAETRIAITILERQNDRLHSSSTSVTMKLLEKANNLVFDKKQ